MTDRYRQAAQTLAEATGKLVYVVGTTKHLAWPEGARLDAALNEAGYALRAFRHVERETRND